MEGNLQMNTQEQREKLLEKIGACDGVIGIAPDLQVCEGYDGHVFGAFVDANDEYSLTRDEKITLARIMIDRWTEYLVEVAK